jgi:hypothetical protein
MTKEVQIEIFTNFAHREIVEDDYVVINDITKDDRSINSISVQGNIFEVGSLYSQHEIDDATGCYYNKKNKVKVYVHWTNEEDAEAFGEY